MKRLMLAAALVTAGAGLARAGDTVVLGRPGLNDVYVWRDHDAYAEAIRLIDAHVYDTNPELVTRLLSCAPKPGDHAVILDGGLFYSIVLVVDGKSAGCRGMVTTEDINKL